VRQCLNRRKAEHKPQRAKQHRTQPRCQKIHRMGSR
jgi:hypothetical protein